MLVNVVKYGSYPTPGNEDHSQKSSKYKDKKKKNKKQITYMKKKTKKLTGSWLYPENDS